MEYSEVVYHHLIPCKDETSRKLRNGSHPKKSQDALQTKRPAIFYKD
uniref:Uncharacterized protein n=1 Tax=Arundo donax TaxID=35708 RepID=A0A0A9C4B9_ARUDO